MIVTIRRKPWALAIIYTGVSLAVEAGLIIVGGLRVPHDNAVIAPIILTVPPALAALISGYRRPKEFVILVILTSILTLSLTIVGGRLTGISTGLVEPIIVRTIAGFLAATIANRVAARTAKAE